LLAFAISLASALSYGISDFLGGTQSRRLPVLAVLAVSQPVGLALSLAVVPILGSEPISAEKFAIAVGAGMAAAVGLGTFYRAMAMGTISVVAPIAALGVMVPVAVGLARGEQPGEVQLAGLALTTLGVVVLSYEESEEHAPVARRSVILAVFSGIAFGLFFTGLDFASEGAGSPGWAVVAVRVGGVAAIAVALVALRPPLGAIPGAIGVLLAIAAFDILGNTLFAIASTEGLLPVVAVGGSMYPAFTIALAHIVLGERLSRSQRAGVALSLLGVALIATGA
jgi:drug/metabolite transporter (DMT)-like permease